MVQTTTMLATGFGVALVLLGTILDYGAGVSTLGGLIALFGIMTLFTVCGAFVLLSISRQKLDSSSS